jgi:hypothetical protein
MMTWSEEFPEKTGDTKNRRIANAGTRAKSLFINASHNLSKVMLK